MAEYRPADRRCDIGDAPRFAVRGPLPTRRQFQPPEPRHLAWMVAIVVVGNASEERDSFVVANWPTEVRAKPRRK